MAIQDPFDSVLTRLGLYQRIQDMEPIHTATVPVTIINTPEAPCRIQWQAFQPNKPEVFQPDMSDNDRLELALQIIKFIHPTPGAATRIRPISLIVGLDWTVEAEPIHMPVGSGTFYPARYRIPLSIINSFPLEEQVWRSEKFALGTLLYELYTGQSIFDGKSDDEVQDQYHRAATFPNLEPLDDLIQCLIYACWSAEFGCYISLGRFEQYVEDNPVRFALQVTGAVVSTALFAVPILGAIGFSAIGPVAGSVAAGWQASIGAVEAGSLFALCQSAAMGGAAAAGLTTTGVSGAAVALAASGFPSPANLREPFIRRFREA